MLIEVSGSRKEEVAGEWKRCIESLLSFYLIFFAKDYLVDDIIDDEMDGSCVTMETRNIPTEGGR